MGVLHASISLPLMQDMRPGSQRGTDQKMLTGYLFRKASILLWLAVWAQQSRPPAG